MVRTAAGKQGSDGPEPDSMEGANGAAGDATTAAAAPTAAAASNGSGNVSSQSGQREAQAGEAPAANGSNLPAADLTTSLTDAASTGDRGASHGVNFRFPGYSRAHPYCIPLLTSQLCICS